MKIFIIISIIILSLGFLALLYLHIKTLRPVRSFLLHALLGLSLLEILNLLSRFTGFSIPINLYTVIGSGVLSAPFVLGILLLNLIL
ncbi:MAG: pro-sigmaK processing inhibitor BofA family protein [Clostridia bacterium]|nr:pro-sigmaK processing inhibitor BofA family protein [Clostridia bacterium]